MKTLIVGIGFRAHSGKDTIGSLLRDMLGVAKVHAVHHKFAGPVRAVAEQFLPLGTDTWDEDFKPNSTAFGITGGQLLQQIGHGMRGVLGETCWIRAMCHRIEETRAAVDRPIIIHIITDVRYRNEAEWIKDNDGILIRADRHVPQDDHPSETEGHLVKWDHSISNNGTLKELAEQVATLVPVLYGKVHSTDLLLPVDSTCLGSLSP